MYLLWCETNPVLKYERCGITLKVIFKIRKVQFGPLWFIWANISETVHAMTNVSVKHIYKVIHNLSVYIKTVDLRFNGQIIMR